MLYTICDACEIAEHHNHTPVLRFAREDVSGEVRCKCLGECVDGRYIYRIAVGTKANEQETDGTGDLSQHISKIATG